MHNETESLGAVIPAVLSDALVAGDYLCSGCSAPLAFTSRHAHLGHNDGLL